MFLNSLPNDQSSTSSTFKSPKNNGAKNTQSKIPSQNGSRIPSISSKNSYSKANCQSQNNGQQQNQQQQNQQQQNQQQHRQHQNHRSLKSNSASSHHSTLNQTTDPFSNEPKLGPKCEAYIMTGDKMLRLDSERSNHNPSGRKFHFSEKSASKSVPSSIPTLNSLPSSPVSDQAKGDSNELKCDNNNLINKNQVHHKQTQTSQNSKMSTPTLSRSHCSKSQDHLLSCGSSTFVEIDCNNMMAECGSNSLNTLLNDDQNKISSGSSSDNEYVFNDDDEPLTRTPKSHSSSDNSSSNNKSFQNATCSSGSFKSVNTPTTTLAQTQTQTQTESSMHENYSIANSISNENEKFGSQQKHKLLRQNKIHFQNTLSATSSIDSTSSANSPEDQSNDNKTLTIENVEFSQNVNSNQQTFTKHPCLEIGSQSQQFNQHNKSYSSKANSSPSVTPQQSISSSISSDEETSDLDSLNSFHYSPPKSIDQPSASRLAKRLFNLEGFKKSDVSRHLSKNNDFSKAVAEEYLKYFDFSGDTLDLALRKFLSRFCLIGETQEKERVLEHFSKRYLDCNNGSIKSYDAIHTLVCALMMLNTDLHGENVGNKMTLNEFIDNLSDMNEGENFPRETLRQLYYAIKQDPLEWAQDDDDDYSYGHDDATNLKSNLNSMGSIGHNPFLEVPNPNSATEFKKGYIMRKCCFDSNGKKTPFGKRSWKMFYATLRDLVLYLHKDEQGFRKNQLYESLNNSIRIHHAFASKAIDYTKKQFVFRLVTADQAEYLFQTSDVRELQCWVDTINLVAASLSAPPLPGGVGSNTKKFQRPLLPVSHTRFNIRDQLDDHENRIYKLERELEELQLPNKNASKRILNEYAEKQSFLKSELRRYRAYVSVLRQKIYQYSIANSQTNISNQSNQISSSSLPSIASNPQPTLINVAIGEESGDDLNGENHVPPITTVKRNHSYDRYSYKQAVFSNIYT